MPRKHKKLRARSRSSKLRLNPRRRELLRLYYEPGSPAFGNGALAAQLAGYKDKPGSNQLSVQAHRVLHHPDFQEATKTELIKQGFGAKFAANFLMHHMRASELRLVPRADGKRMPRRVPILDAQMRAYDRAWRIFAGNGQHLPQQPASPGVLPEALGGLPAPTRTEAWRGAAGDRLEQVQKLSPQGRMVLRDGLTAVDQYMKRSKKKIEAQPKPAADDPGSPKGENE